ncbi:hypothetical protein GE09DRAFT_1226280 [Coniochaeta sp. 2T2.1]|nr:hypothetical protein GE09DRAFT_1226280 [Coniochaeta sp. 2T2.1]
MGPPEKKETREEEEPIDPVMDALVKAGMMEELGNCRLDDLPLEDNHHDVDKHGRPVNARRQRPATQNTPTTAKIWKEALEGGLFKDKTAEEVAGLDDLGGGRSYANREEMVRGEVGRALHRMNPLTMQHQAPQRHPMLRGPELHPRHQNRNARQSKLGICFMPDMPIHKFGPGSNRITTNVLAPIDGNAAGGNTQPNHVRPTNLLPQATDLPKPQGTASGHPGSAARATGPSPPPARTNGHPVVPQRATMRVQPSAPTFVQWAGAARTNGHPMVPQQATMGSRPSAPPSGPNPTGKSQGTGSLLDLKRRNAAFELKVKYIKGGGTNLNKSATVIVLVTQDKIPHMGYYLLFVEKPDESYRLELNVVLNIVQTAVDSAHENHVLVRIQENETRVSVHRLIFGNAGAANQLISTIKYLMSARPKVASSASPTKPAALEVDGRDNNTSSTPSAAATPGKQIAQHVAIASTNGTVNTNSTANTNGTANTGGTANTTMVDLLSDMEMSDVVNDQLSSAGTAANKTPAIVHDNALFDFEAEDPAPTRALTDVSSNTDMLTGVQFNTNLQEAAVMEEDVTSEMAAQEAIKTQVQDMAGDGAHETVMNDDGQSVFPENAVAARMYDTLVQKSLSFLDDFAIPVGETDAQRSETLRPIRETIAEAARGWVISIPSYFSDITVEQKLQVVDKFLANTTTTGPKENATEPETSTQGQNAAEGTATQSPDEASIPESGHSPTSTTAAVASSFHSSEDTYVESPALSSTTAVDSLVRYRYAQHEMLAINNPAATPPLGLSGIEWPVQGGQRARQSTVSTAADNDTDINETHATPDHPVTPKTPTSGPPSDRPVIVTPLGRNMATQRATEPPTPPMTNQVPTVDKLCRGFSGLSLMEKPKSAAPPTPPVAKEEPVREAPAAIPKPADDQTNGTQSAVVNEEQVTPVDAPTVQVNNAENATPAARVEISDNATPNASRSLAEIANMENGTRNAAPPTGQVNNRDNRTLATRGSRVNNTENATPVAVAPAAPVNGHPQGAVQQIAAPRVVEHRGLGASRFAPEAHIQVRHPGEFRGAEFERLRRHEASLFSFPFVS